jgi:uncharacterized membrane protein YdjX (TVP38/TMEM64 family)
MIKNLMIRMTAAVIILFLATGLVYFAFLQAMPELIPLLQSGNVAEIEHYLRSSDRFSGLVCTALLQVVQVVSVVLPGAPIQIAAGIVYGAWRSFFVCHLSSVAASVIVFMAARRFGVQMDKLRPIERKDSKLDFLLKSDTPAYMTVVACLIPILPNGFIPYVAAKTKIRTLHYALAVYCGSFLPVLVLCAAGSKILKGGYLMSGILLAVLCILVFLLAKFKNKILKRIGALTAKRRKASQQN